MEGVGWVGAIIIGGLAGWIASRVMETGTGIIANIIIGIVGAVVLNTILVATIGYTYGGWVGQLGVGAVGAIVLIFVYRLVTSRNPA
ncbi:MAG TPA: GlsB/YeaQ/YmgE family stress response membrane protein [Rhodospirillales bacterium]|jgi:uncharacterized membrane protein YeaQ/YmgE (transglycosylase-associated protein family)